MLNVSLHVFFPQKKFLLLISDITQYLAACNNKIIGINSANNNIIRRNL